MDTNFNVFSENEVNYSTEKKQKFKLRFLDILLFIGCLVAAFIFWCYALYSYDPVVERTITVNLVLENAQEGDQLSTTSTKMVVYGEQSLFLRTRTITVKIDRSEFDIYNKDTVIEVEFPDGIYSKTNTVTLQLTNKSNK